MSEDTDAYKTNESHNCIELMPINPMNHAIVQN